MTFISHAIEVALMRLTEELIANHAHCADTVVCAQGRFYRAEIRLEPIKAHELSQHLAE
ncbi:hypothetical protein LOS15_06355 [Halomonas sp. 7T]|uniref:hypothetical protein n=1 Tax=Halomonas sp. 7T TaxID=2893469 RepID=UPI0021D8FDC7|nr:hypothetical protein [Halomonas sp. 7T]UXZ55644.1 hypothetical protein LOS15_06355 [Halomonas sp. 7T]